MNEPTPNASWTQLYHPRGPRVTLSLPGDPMTVFKTVSDLLDAGWLVTAPGLDDGEEKMMVGWVLRSTHEKDGEYTPTLLLYADNEALTWSFLRIWFNSDADRLAFEYASKMKFESLPDYVGNDKPQRGASQKTDRFIVQAPKPFGVVFKKNPKHDPNDEAAKMKPARLFVRWEIQMPTKAAEASPTTPQQTAPPKPTNGQAASTIGADMVGREMWLVKHNFCRSGELCDFVKKQLMVKDFAQVRSHEEAVASARRFYRQCFNTALDNEFERTGATFSYAASLAGIHPGRDPQAITPEEVMQLLATLAKVPTKKTPTPEGAEVVA